MNRLTASLAESRQPARLECVKESPDKIVKQLLADIKINRCCVSVTFWYGSEVFLLISVLFGATFTSKTKNHQEVTKQWESKDFLTIFA